MEVIFLSSAYFGYVHTWAFEPDTSCDVDRGAADAEPPQERRPAVAAERRPWRARWAAIFGRREEDL